MRRRWKALVPVGAVALAAGLLFLLPPRGDGLDWLRSYGGTERDLVDQERSFVVLRPDRRVELTAFDFRKIPKELILDVKNRAIDTVIEDSKLITADIPDGRIITVDLDRMSVYVSRNREATWLERQWSAIKTRLGFY